ncbi:MAG: DUF4956 domain-containing protein [Vicinamibacteria bacterium]
MDIIDRLFGASTAAPAPLSVHEIVGAILLSFVLTLLIAMVYRFTHRGTYYTQDYVHSLILLGMVVTAVIMVVGHSMERAFAVFAAFSVIRFRRSVPETRDIGFIFFAMAVGMASGARQYALAVLTTLVVGAAVLVIAKADLFAPVRAAHFLRLRVAPGLDVDRDCADAFRTLFESTRLRSVESSAAKAAAELRYEVLLRKGVFPDTAVRVLGRVEGVERIVLLEPVPERDW